LNPSHDALAVEPWSSDRSFPVVGIGASAGGLEALEAFLTHLPAACGMAFVVVQHLDPAHTSLMPELLAHYTKIPVQAAADGLRVAPNHLYVMPPNVTLTIQDGVLQAATPVAQSSVRTHIDTFLRSLAEDQGPRAIGVILSGAGSDGTLGLKAIKEHGGITVVQSPASAKYDSMPLSALATGLVDYTLPVEEIPAKLVAHAAYVVEVAQRQSSDLLAHEIADHLPRICEILHHATGHDFRGYKPNTMVRRVARRLQVLHLEAVGPYITQLEHDGAEPELLFKDLLIGVTQFFRDPAAFEALARQALPELLQDKASESRVRVWVPGCASGEEAYSLAILLSEQMTQRNIAPQVQIFATDIDEEAIALARAGRYPASSIEPMAPERRDRYFLRQGELYQVNRQIRDLCVFSLHNLVRDPPFSALDLISCRNLLIYLDAGLQKKLIPLFHYALAPHGYLFLGSSEGLANFGGLFREVDKKYRIFARIEAAVRPAVVFPLAEPRGPAGPQAVPHRLPEQRKALDIGGLVERVAQDYAPPCVVINERGQIVYCSGDTGLYLQQPTGTPTLNITDQARKGLRLGLRTALREAFRTGAAALQKDLAVRTPLGLRVIDLLVRPLPEPAAAAGLWAVVFVPATPVRDAAAGAAMPAAESAVAQLETELKTTRGELQTAVEELEGANEELKSSNEELLSMNEELQSANEELQTSKEEMQSVNEELGTINTELNRKVEQLDRANSDLQNLIRSTEIATLFLDGELRLKRFTPAAAAIFHLLESDAGRPISVFALRFADIDLVAEIKTVLQTLATRERPAHLPEQDAWYMVRILPSRTTDNAIDGVVVTLTNITALKHAEASLQQSQGRFGLPTEGLQDYAHCLLDLAGRVVGWNAGAQRLHGYSAEEARGQSAAQFYPPDEVDGGKVRHALAVAAAEGRFEGESWRVRKDGTRFAAHIILTALRDPQGRISGFSEVVRDITERRQAQEALRRSHDELCQANADLQAQMARRRQAEAQARQLEREIVDVAGTEQRRIGQELHDGLGQMLAGAAMLAQSLHQKLPDKDAAPAALAAELSRQLQAAQVQVQNLARGLVAVEVDPEGLMAALQNLVRDTSAVHGLAATFSCAQPVSVRDSATATQLYRIAQEALTNVVKHSRARRALVALAVAGGQIELLVRDDGAGFTPQDEAGAGWAGASCTTAPTCWAPP